MDSISKLEGTIEGWMKSFPHLPENVRKWIAQYAWAINLIGLILSAVMLVVAIGGIIFAYIAASTVTSYTALYYGLSGYSQAFMITTIIAILSFAATIVLTAMAIKPLKSMNKRGWDLLFIVALIEVVFSIISAVADFSVFTIIPNLIFTAIGFMIGMYILFEIRSYFAKSSKVVEAKKVPETVRSAK